MALFFGTILGIMTGWMIMFGFNWWSLLVYGVYALFLLGHESEEHRRRTGEPLFPNETDSSARSYSVHRR